MIVVNMDKAREIQRDRIRAARAPLFDQLDLAFMRAMEAGDTAALEQVAAQKQALRDATRHPDIELAQTPDELAAVFPFPTE